MAPLLKMLWVCWDIDISKELGGGGGGGGGVLILYVPNTDKQTNHQINKNKT